MTIRVDVASWKDDIDKINLWFYSRDVVDVLTTMRLMSEVIVEWSRPGNPRYSNSYASMEFPEYDKLCREIDRAVREAIKKRRHRMKTTLVFAHDFPHVLERESPPPGRVTVDHLIDRGLLHVGILLQVAENFGWTLEYVRGLNAFEINEILGYLEAKAELIRMSRA